MRANPVTPYLLQQIQRIAFDLNRVSSRETADRKAVTDGT
jgi:hypothetical protein